MSKTELEQLLSKRFQYVKLTSADGVHFDLSIKDECFANLSRLDSHKMVNSILKPYLESGEIHAVSIKIIK